MTTIIDGSVADIKFENEKTIGDVLTGIESWVSESGFCLSRVNIDGAEAETSDMDVLFEAEIKDTKTLLIETKPFAMLYEAALDELKRTLSSWQQVGGDKRLVEELWRKSPAAAFIDDHDKELSYALRAGFSDETINNVVDMVNERSVEARKPLSVFSDMEKELNEEIARMEDLPLDLQTGNDRRAAETIERFSVFMQKILRLFPLLKYAIPEKPDTAYSLLFEEVKSALKEFLVAYENKDMVLSGDLAEYEIAPRVKNIYSTLKKKLSLEAGG
jgi:flagellin-specific chaperone FliS